jgi:BlaI family transcriptional regulator, penicillinase repressor
LKTEEIIQTRHNSLTLTPLELDIMKAVWRHHPITVRDVQVAIRPDRPLAYTTVMTVMHRLYLKGFLQRTLQSKAHYYEPKVEFADVRDAAVSGIIRHFFRGSRDEFLQFLENNSSAAPEISAPSALDETLL